MVSILTSFACPKVWILTAALCPRVWIFDAIQNNGGEFDHRMLVTG